jgi:hypothetical protein
MAKRALGALFALAAALAFVVAIASSAFWSGHPIVNGRPITAKDVHVGLLGAQGCNTGGDGSCEAVDVSGTFKLASYAELGATALATLLAFLVAIAAWRLADNRKGLAKASLAMTLLAGAGAGAVFALGPAIKASQTVEVPIGWGLFVFMGAIASSLLASTITRSLEREPLRLKPTNAPLLPPAQTDIRQMLHGHSAEPAPRDSASLFNAAPQLRPLYDPQNAGYSPPPAAPTLPNRAPTPMPHDQIERLTGKPQPAPLMPGRSLSPPSAHELDWSAPPTPAPTHAAPPGMSQSGMSPSGMSPPSISPPGMSPQGMSPQGMSPQGMSRYGASPPEAMSAPRSLPGMSGPSDSSSRGMPPSMSPTRGKPMTAPPPSPPPTPPRTKPTTAPPLGLARTAAMGAQSPSDANSLPGDHSQPARRPGPSSPPAVRPIVPSPDRTKSPTNASSLSGSASSSRMKAPSVPPPAPGSSSSSSSSSSSRMKVPSVPPPPSSSSSSSRMKVPSIPPLSSSSSRGKPPTNAPAFGATPSTSAPPSRPSQPRAATIASAGATPAPERTSSSAIKSHVGSRGGEQPRQPTLAMAVPPMPRAATENDDRLETGMRATEFQTAVEIDHEAKAAAQHKPRKATEDIRTGGNRIVGDVTDPNVAAPDDPRTDAHEEAGEHTDVGVVAAPSDEPKAGGPVDLNATMEHHGGGPVDLNRTMEQNPRTDFGAAIEQNPKTPVPTLTRSPSVFSTETPVPTLSRAPSVVATETPMPTRAQSVPISTAPSSLPPPKETSTQSTGPTPACPQCESPMAWVDEHLRFYCKSCRMYF